MGKYHLLIITAWICVSFFWKINIKIVHSVFHRVHFCHIYDLINLDIVCFGLNKYMLYTTISYEIMMFGNYPLNDFFVIILSPCKWLLKDLHGKILCKQYANVLFYWSSIFIVYSIDTKRCRPLIFRALCLNNLDHTFWISV